LDSYFLSSLFPPFPGCNCHIHGSQGRICDHRTGQCKCKPNVEGRTCDLCTHGHWNIDSNVGCIKCACNSVGSDDTGCDTYSGQCFCKPGVEGLNCDRCQSGHYGFSHHGCKRCDVCESPAYVCDSDTGRCVCPPMSHGPNCKSCVTNSWGNVFQKGCRSCECDMLGSVGQTCDPESGQCSCKEGYAGRQCDYCAAGYYGYPSCKRCGCDPRGSIALENGAVDCDEFGQCPCKELVTGLKCDTCRQATFGLAHFNPMGCTRCFCFGRSKECVQNDLSWGQIRAQCARNLSVEYSSYQLDSPRHARQDYEYVVVMQIEGARMNREDAEIKTKNNLNLIPSSTGNVSIGSYVGFYYPLYFQLPPQFLGDQIRSYGGVIKFSLTTVGWSARIPEDILRQHPLIQLHSHRQLILDYYSVSKGN
jgi:laminin, alpha 1/2